MDPMKPTLTEMLNYHVRGFSTLRILWNRDKQKASKKVSTSVFNKNLGPALDELRDVCEYAINAKKKGATLDDKMQSALKSKADKVNAIIREYKSICKSNEEKVDKKDVEKKNAWNDLTRSLTGSLENGITNWLIVVRRA